VRGEEREGERDGVARVRCSTPPTPLCSSPLSSYTVMNAVTGETDVKIYTPDHAAAPDAFKDAATGAELEVQDKAPLLEWLAENYKKFGCALEFVTNKSQARRRERRGSGGGKEEKKNKKPHPVHLPQSLRKAPSSAAGLAAWVACCGTRSTRPSLRPNSTTATARSGIQTR